MNDDYSDAIKEIATLSPHDAVMLETLTIWHPVGGGLNIVNAPEDLWAYADATETVRVLFKASSFALSLPESSMEGTQYLNLTVPNVNREASDFIDRIPIDTSEPATVIYRVYASNIIPMIPQNDPPITLTLTDISIGLTSASARCSFKSVINQKYPNDYYTLEEFPALSN